MKNLNDQTNQDNILNLAEIDEKGDTLFIGVGPIKMNGVELGYSDGKNITWDKAWIRQEP